MADCLEASDSNRFIAQLCRTLFAAEGSALQVLNSHDTVLQEVTGSNLGRDRDFSWFPFQEFSFDHFLLRYFQFINYTLPYHSATYCLSC
jgi:hypothetical protein